MVLVALIGISSLKGTIEAIEGFLGGAFSFSTEERTNSSELLFLGSMENFIRIVELADSSVEVGISRVTLYRDARSSVHPRTTRRVTVVGTHDRASVVSKETASVVSKVTASWF